MSGHHAALRLMTMNLAAEMARTPDNRDRYVDLLRVASLGVVIVGHWLMAVVLVGNDGAVSATNVLALQPSLQPLTWLLQVMPVFFLVGGFSHATALASIQRRGGTYADFVRSRAGRLLRPTALFVAVWLLVGLVIELSGHYRGVFELATRTVAQPLWFLGVYLGVVALAPAMLRLHRRWPTRPYAVPVTLIAGAVAVDLLRFGLDVGQVGFLNVALVWLAVHQLGFLYADGVLVRAGRGFAAALAVAGLAVVVALTAYGPYPVSMVGMPGDRISNMAPPTIALLAHSLWLTGLVLLLRGPVSAWLRRERVWRNVIVANGLAMTAFLWHLTALFAATVVTLAVGLAQPAAGSVAWWLLRPLWIAVLAVLTLGLVSAFRRADRPRLTRDTVRTPTAGRRRHTTAAGLGIALAALGILGLSVVGFGGLLAGRSATLVVLPVTPLAATVMLGFGVVLLNGQGGQGRRGGRDGRPRQRPATRTATDPDSLSVPRASR
jgi:hypothetical protein